MVPVKGYAAFDAETPLKPWSFERREPGPGEVLIDILWCGICHSDVHMVRNDMGGTRYPLVPGHEIVGTVARVGEGVSRFRVGDRVGVGCMVDSCRHCEECAEGLEQYCAHMVPTYGGVDKHDQPTQGGYSSKITVDQDFVLTIPAAIPLERAAPLLCAGVTTWSPLKRWKAGRGTRVAVIGLGGLGHMAVQLAVAMGCEVTVISTSDRKEADALRLGAHDFRISRDRDAMRAARGRFDLILNTVSAAHEINPHARLLARDGTMVMLGLTTEALHLNALPLISRRRSVAGSLIGGIRETQEMLDFCAEHGIAAEVETIAPAGINQAYERMLKSDVRYRFVIDMAAI